MQLRETPLSGVYVVESEPVGDDRGLFARTFDAGAFRAAGLDPVVEQCSTSFNAAALTLRGLHHQAGEHAEAKLVRCTRGRIFDVAVDLRPDSLTYLQWHGVHLRADDRRALYVPKGCAHGFLTLEDETEVFYQISVPYAPGSARGLRWDDPVLGIAWPATPRVVSPKDAGHPLLPR